MSLLDKISFLKNVVPSLIEIVGDVDFESSKGKVAAITPVPGGVGVVTNYCLVENILKTFKLQNKRK